MTDSLLHVHLDLFHSSSLSVAVAISGILNAYFCDIFLSKEFRAHAHCTETKKKKKKKKKKRS
jgi:hypothetical protein